MRRIICAGAFALFCALSTFAGPGDSAGAEPTPTPTPCVECPDPEGGGNAATTSDGALTALLIDGVLFIVSLVP